MTSPGSNISSTISAGETSEIIYVRRTNQRKKTHLNYTIELKLHYSYNKLHLSSLNIHITNIANTAKITTNFVNFQINLFNTSSNSPMVFES
jgi:hypothetical protein